MPMISRYYQMIPGKHKSCWYVENEASKVDLNLNGKKTEALKFKWSDEI